MIIVFNHKSPAQRLTFDILWSIFRFVIVVDGSRGPKAISHVCRSWRGVALQTDFLWSKIIMRFYHPDQLHENSLARLERSRQHLLEVTLHFSREITEGEYTVLLQQQSTRFRKLKLYFGTEPLARPLLQKLRMLRLPVLEEYGSLTGINMLVQVSRNASLLVSEPDSDASIIPLVEGIDPETKVVWTKWHPKFLTHLKLSFCNGGLELLMNDICCILESTKNTLQSLEFEDYMVLDEDFTFINPIKFPQLRALNIAYFFDINNFLDIFDAPRLDRFTLRNLINCPAHHHTLSLGLDEYPHPIDTPHLLNTIKSWTSLTHLGLFSVDRLPFDDVLSLLQSMSPKLESLILYGEGGAVDIAKLLFLYPPTELPLLPKLQHLMCTISDHQSDFQAYIRTRQVHNLPPLEKLTLNIGFIGHLINQGEVGILREAALVVKSIVDPFHKVYLGPVVEQMQYDNRHYWMNINS